jgi:hypothetical protein
MSFVVHRVTKSAARYTDAGGREKCAWCRFFMAPRACGKVVGPVSPQGWCKYFSRQVAQQYSGAGFSGGGGASFDQNFLTSSLGTGAVFTRASTGMYYNASGVLVSAAINTPRFDYDPRTLQLKGLLLEDASTNIITQSVPNGGPWGASAVTVTAASGIAPDGTNTMVRVAETATTAFHTNYCVVTIVASTVYTVSVYAKAAQNRYLQLMFDNGASSQLFATFDLQTGSISGPLTAAGGAVVGTASIQDVGNGIYRCTISGNLGAFTTGRIFTTLTNVANAGALPSYAGNASNGLLVWGAQVEALSYMSSHIPTTSVSVTRARDSLVYPAAALTGFSTTQGSWFAEFIDNIPAGVNSPRVVGSPSAALTPIWIASGLNANSYDGTAVVGSVNVFAVNTVAKAASTWAAGTAKVVLNAGVVNSGSQPTGYGALATAGVSIGGGSPNTSNETLSGWARRISYWPRVLSDSEMQAVTTLAGPTLSLDFMQSGTLDPRVTFTRASSATYTDASGVIQTAATNAPRWDYANGVMRGLLIEEQRTNVCLQSAGVAVGGAWALFGNIAAAPTVTANNAVAPDGTTTATRMVIPAVSGGGSSVTYQPFTATAAPYTYSVWLRGNAGGEQVYVGAGGPGLYYSIPRITLTTQWQRFMFTTPALTAAGWTISVGTDLRDGTQTSTPAQTIYAWGAQVEQGAFPTSYIPTTSVSVTRAADVATMPTNVSWFSATTGTIMNEALSFGSSTAGAFNTTTSLNDGGAGNRIETVRNDLTNLVSEYLVISGAFTSANVGSVGPNVIFRAVMNYAVGGQRGTLNGAAVTAIGTSAVLPPVTQMTIGSVVNAQFLNGYIRRVTYWNRALSDTEMQQVTT